MNFIKRLMEIKEWQIEAELEKIRLLEAILKELKGGVKNGKYKSK